ncbi:trehalose-6-phosphate synthase [Fulvimarina sp. 2208YS6-2-32]|uniref:Trehalose-6-phosphate synthase n=1 Tax=Fulvimarina uroteuthidis TaxID=3098149 RepID=A0ABU5I031_9HYPH|nr:trehalose-6-phosphate synthase [Fulvimarina sp. 2208YS6-2-32]MDY8108566.1 trehalose-6-phosphate synthase [Fulvimarina sp. 2208YS6-2-32]
MAEPESRLVAVSNRVGPLSDEGQAGGLVVGLSDALKRRGGLWFGWSGETSDEGTHSQERTEVEGNVAMTTIDLTEEELNGFYYDYANRSLWPLLHYRLDLAEFDRASDRIYRKVNHRFAVRLMPHLKENDLVWVHDYHFFYMGSELRQAGYNGRLGYFLHIPFCAPEVFSALPASHDIVRALLAYDVIGFQTDTDRRNFVGFCVRELGGRKLEDGRVEVGDRTVIAKAFPIGIDAESYSRFAVSPEASSHEEMLLDMSRDRRNLKGEEAERKLIVGVDRMDYSKGLLERFYGFERLLEDYPENRGCAIFLQVAPLSRSELDAYADLRSELERTAGHINGRFATLDWTPLQMMTRGFTRKALAGIYRAARVCLVTPLRDGMNLVAKEFVAAQDPEDPGVLVLSRFAGAHAELECGCIVVNPYNTDDVAGALQTALTMPLEERKRRWELMREAVFTGTAQHWCQSFLATLEAVGEAGAGSPPSPPS